MMDLDYKVIKLIYRSEEPIKISYLSKKMLIPHSTLGSCIKRLKNKGYVNYEAYHEVKLTSKGSNLAKELIRHARLMEMLLHYELGVKLELAHRESEELNLLFSCETINKICKKYGHPKKCPCGEEILSSSHCICETEMRNKG
ncbi:MAG: metal-dependent transcriptional regulator [Candidatus Lokiarchaeota archaeon]|nr:metal-dependent transcriptional regulator [Candidatus Lokiarchaeota archaeon]